MSADPVAALIAILLAETKITDLAGTRVFGIELPRAQSKNQPRYAIVVKPAGGASTIGGYLEHTTGRFDVICLAGTPHDAFKLSTHVNSTLRRFRRQVVATGDVSVLVHSVEEAGGQVSTRDRATEWPVTSQAFQLLYAIKEVA